jgi:hypothetical protein
MSELEPQLPSSLMGLFARGRIREDENSNPRGKAAKAEDEIDRKHSRENFMVIDCSVSDGTHSLGK